MMRVTLLVFLLLLSGAAYAQKAEPILGLYKDSFSGTSARIGVAYSYSASSGRYIFADVEFGSDANGLSVGYGVFESAASIRAGLCVSRKETTDFVGLEGVVSIWLLALKAEVYQNLETGNQHLSAGFGIGF